MKYTTLTDETISTLFKNLDKFENDFSETYDSMCDYADEIAQQEADDLYPYTSEEDLNINYFNILWQEIEDWAQEADDKFKKYINHINAFIYFIKDFKFLFSDLGKEFIFDFETCKLYIRNIPDKQRIDVQLKSASYTITSWRSNNNQTIKFVTCTPYFTGWQGKDDEKSNASDKFVIKKYPAIDVVNAYFKDEQIDKLALTITKNKNEIPDRKYLRYAVNFAGYLFNEIVALSYKDKENEKIYVSERAKYMKLFNLKHSFLKEYSLRALEVITKFLYKTDTRENYISFYKRVQESGIEYINRPR